MTDKLSNTEAELRELLILAAKAADIEITTWSNCQAGGFRAGGICLFWNPATDDGDSRRLEVALGMNVYINDSYCIAEIVSDSDEPPVHKKEYCNSDTKVAATRLAVLRAAAEVGRSME